jgi:hypothetical protein
VVKLLDILSCRHWCHTIVLIASNEKDEITDAELRFTDLLPERKSGIRIALRKIREILYAPTRPFYSCHWQVCH